RVLIRGELKTVDAPSVVDLTMEETVWLGEIAILGSFDKERLIRGEIDNVDNVTKGMPHDELIYEVMYEMSLFVLVIVSIELEHIKPC
ncbi:MAG: hypothetical protein M1834_005109, partial [Cirrosporium novae-zelandiae]